MLLNNTLTSYLLRVGLITGTAKQNFNVIRILKLNIPKTFDSNLMPICNCLPALPGAEGHVSAAVDK